MIEGNEFDLTPKILSRIYSTATDGDGTLTVTSKFVNGGTASTYLKTTKSGGDVTMTRTNGSGNEGASDPDNKLSVTIYYNAGTNYAASKKFTVLFNTYLSLEEYSWTRIQEMVQDNTLADNIDVGDKKSFRLSGSMYSYKNTDEKRNVAGEKVYAVLIGINHNPSVEGARMAHFAVVKNITTSNGVNYWHVFTPPDETTIGESGYVDRSLYTFYNLRDYYGTFYTDNLQGEPHDFIKNCKKYVGTSSNTFPIWELSYYEVYGNKPSGYSESTTYQKQYEYFANGNTVLAATFKGNKGGNVPVWSRSYNVSTFLGILSNTPGELSVGAIGGYIPCFAIG